MKIPIKLIGFASLFLIAVMLALNSVGCVNGSTDRDKLGQYRAQFVEAKNTLSLAFEQKLVSPARYLEGHEYDLIGRQALKAIARDVDSGKSIEQSAWNFVSDNLYKLQATTPTPKMKADLSAGVVIGLIYQLARWLAAAKLSGKKSLTEADFAAILEGERAADERADANAEKARAEIAGGAD